MSSKLESSILLTIRKMRVGNEEDDSFDLDLLTHINTALYILRQHNVGDTRFVVTGTDETWSDFLGEDLDALQGVITYVDVYVHLMFDPPSSSYHTNLLNDQKRELEFRLNISTDPDFKQ